MEQQSQAQGDVQAPLKVVHKTQGRLRIRPFSKLSSQQFIRYEQIMDQLLPNHEFMVNSHTQSFLILHENEATEIMKRIRDHIPLFDETLFRHQRVKIAKLREEFQSQIHKVDRMLMEYTEGELDLKSLTALALLGMGYFQTFKRQKFLPAGETLFAAGFKFLLKG